MLRFLASVVLRLLANAVGVALAAWLLDGFSVTTAAFVWVVILFTVIEVVLDPLVLKISLQYAPALRGGVALVSTLVGLIITTLISDGLVINGLTAWVVGTLIVWLGGVLAALLLPLFIFKSVREQRKEGNA
jgi:putative membrane protein